MPTTLLKVRNLIVTLEAKGASRRLVSDVSFDLKDQQVLCIIGESGSGKTVLSRALVNWINPPLRIAGGSVEFHGRDLLKLSDKQIQKIAPEINDQADKVIDAADMLVLPGFVQSHVHLCQSLLRGQADDQPLLDWLETITSLEFRHTPET